MSFACGANWEATDFTTARAKDVMAGRRRLRRAGGVTFTETRRRASAAIGATARTWTARPTSRSKCATVAAANERSACGCATCTATACHGRDANRRSLTSMFASARTVATTNGSSTTQFTDPQSPPRSLPLLSTAVTSANFAMRPGIDCSANFRRKNPARNLLHL